MLTRRSMMLASIAAGVIMNNRTASAKAAQPATPVNFDVPAGACDCHTHIHPDPAKFPFFAGRVYTPELASPEEMTALHKALQHGARGDRHAVASTAPTTRPRCSAWRRGDRPRAGSP